MHRIFLGESDRWKHQPLYEAIVLKARARQLAGATVLRGPVGFGAASRIHTAKILQRGGLITLEEVQVIHYRGGTGRG